MVETPNVRTVDAPPSDEMAFLQQLQAEAGGDLSPADQAAMEVLAKEIKEAELARDIAARAIKKARSYQGQETETQERHVDVDCSRMGWIGEDEVLVMPTTRVSGDESSYDFVDLIGLSSTTQALARKLDESGMGRAMRQEVRERNIPRLWRDIQEGGRNVRPIHDNGKSRQVHALNTTYPAYKINVHGTHNRAIVLILGKNSDNTPVLGLAALYDHADDRVVHSKLFV